MVLLMAVAACKGTPGGGGGAGGPSDSGPLCGDRMPCQDAGPDAGIDAGTDAGIDAGYVPPPAADAGVDAGPVAPPDAGPDPHTPGALGWGPFPKSSLTVYGSAQGLEEGVISAAVDEGEDLWVVSTQALYLLTPGATAFRRFTAADGLHLGAPYTEPPDITMVEGGRAGECFVGYYAHDTNDSMFAGAHTWTDPIAHMGKMDQVLLQRDGTLVVNRYDLRNSNDGHYYETRTVMSMVYDHFQHPGNLYVGSNHGITRILPAKYVPQHIDPADPGNTGLERTWFADHVHPWVCFNQCTGDPSVDHIAFGDWFGLALAPDGRLWLGGLYSAGAVHYREALADWIQSWKPVNPFDPAFGDPYPPNEPVFDPPKEADPVNIHAVSVAPDGVIWFASGEVESWRGPTYGIASWDGHRFAHFDPTALGAIEYNTLELQALDDGRLVLGFPSSGLLVWMPGDAKGHRLTVSEGLPGQHIGRMSTDRMHAPPLLLVPTEGGLALFRDVP